MQATSKEGKETRNKVTYRIRVIGRTWLVSASSEETLGCNIYDVSGEAIDLDDAEETAMEFIDANQRWAEDRLRTILDRSDDEAG